HRLRAHRQFAQHRHHPALRADPRRCAARRQSRLRARLRHGGHHRRLQPRLHPPERLREPARRAMNGGKILPWSAVGIGPLYFFVPLLCTFEFALRMRRGAYSFDAYGVVFADPRFQASFAYSAALAVATIVLGIILVVPAAYAVRLRLPSLRGPVELLTLMP